MAILEYDIEVNGADKAEKAIEGVDDAARAAADGMRAADGAADQLGRGLSESEKAARRADEAFEDAARSAAKAGRAADSAGAGVGGLNDKVKNGLTGFDEFAGRLGQVGNALNLLSGVAIVGLVTGIADGVRALYEMTEAGKAAKIQSEANARAIDAHTGKLKDLKKVTEEVIDATFASIRADALKETVGAKMAEQYVRITEAEAAVGAAVRNTGILREREQAQLERAGVSERKRAEIRNAMATAIKRAEGAQKAAIETLKKERAAYEADAQTVARVNKELERLATVVTPAATTATVATTRAVTGLTMGYHELGRAMVEAGNAYARYGDEIVLLPDDVALPDPATISPLLDAVRDGIGDVADLYGDAVAEAMRLVDQTRAVAGNLISARDGALGLADGMSSALDVATQMASSIRTAYDAVTDAQMIATRNATTIAGEQLAAAQAAERRAIAEAQAAGISAENSTLVAQKARERHAAEEAVYKAQLAQAKAEEDAAAARQIFQAVDYALEGGKAAAKSIEAAALASMLAALPFGVGAPFVPAAITASVTYGVAAAAYGVGAGAALAAETPRSARPQPPDPLIDPATTREAGRRDSGQLHQGDVYVEFHGVPSAMFGDVVIDSIDKGNKRRTRRRTDISRRNRGR